jgi:hypothetical protein
MRIAFTLGFVALACGLASPARAEPSIGVIVTGEGSVQPQLTAQITDWLSRHGHTVIASPLPPEAIPQLADCFVLERLTCAREIVETLAKSSSLLYARVDASNDRSGERSVTLTAYWFDKGHDAVAERKTCERCTPQSLRTTADEIMRKLIGGEGHVKLRSTPPAAHIRIDDQEIGVTPLDWDLPPGKHTIQMRLPGLTPASQDLVVVGGKTDLVTMQLTPPPEEPGQLWSRHVPLGIVITGGALIAAGGIMIVVDQDPGPREPPTIHNTEPAGVAMVIGGVVVAGAGAYLRWFRSGSKTSTPIAVFTSNTAYVGWTGQF